jgi:hypothetical protein
MLPEITLTGLCKNKSRSGGFYFKDDQYADDGQADKIRGDGLYTY